MVITEFVFLVLVLLGLILIAIGHKFRLSEHKSFLGKRPWSKNGINPFSPFDSWKRRDWWSPSGFKIHLVGVLIFGVGLIINILRILYSWV